MTVIPVYSLVACALLKLWQAKLGRDGSGQFVLMAQVFRAYEGSVLGVGDIADQDPVTVLGRLGDFHQRAVCCSELVPGLEVVKVLTSGMGFVRSN